MVIRTTGKMKNNMNNSPMDYDLTFNKNSIPSNIKFNNSFDLTLRLQEDMPANTTIHLNLDTTVEDSTSQVGLMTRIETIYNGVKMKRRIL